MKNDKNIVKCIISTSPLAIRYCRHSSPPSRHSVVLSVRALRTVLDSSPLPAPIGPHVAAVHHTRPRRTCPSHCLKSPSPHPPAVVLLAAVGFDEDGRSVLVGVGGCCRGRVEHGAVEDGGYCCDCGFGREEKASHRHCPN